MRLRAGRALLLVVASAVAVLTAGCGAPEFTYVTNSDDRTYLRVPAEWGAVDEGELVAALGLDPSVPIADQGIWIQGYDAEEPPSAAHLLGPHAPAPTVLVAVLDVAPTVRGQYSLDRLRDLFQPVSPAARQQIAANPMSGFSGFALMRDEVLTPGDGLRGVHVVYRYRIGGGPFQVFDKTAYLNDDASKVYMFVVRCSTECYEQRQQEIERVVSSFTVREGS